MGKKGRSGGRTAVISKALKAIELFRSGRRISARELARELACTRENAYNWITALSEPLLLADDSEDWTPGGDPPRQIRYWCSDGQ